MEFKFLWALAEEDLKDLIEGTEDPELLTTAERKIDTEEKPESYGYIDQVLGRARSFNWRCINCAASMGNAD